MGPHFERRPISRSEWQKRLADCRALSGRYGPVGAADFTEYTCRAGEFIDGPTYLVRFTNGDGAKLVDWDDPEATPITIKEFAQNPEFVNDLLHAWGDGTPIRTATLLVQRCSTCGRSLVIDGVHRVVAIAASSALDAELHISELAGASWPPDMPDMKTVCVCRGMG